MKACRFLAQTDVPIALARVCFEGEERKWRGLAAMSLSDPKRAYPAASADELIWINAVGEHFRFYWLDLSPRGRSLFL